MSDNPLRRLHADNSAVGGVDLIFSPFNCALQTRSAPRLLWFFSNTIAHVHAQIEVSPVPIVVRQGDVRHRKRILENLEQS